MSRKNARSTEESSAEARFLAGVALRPVTLPSGVPFRAVGLGLGQGTSPLEVLIASTAAPPNATTLRSAWKARNAGRAAPFLFVVLHGERASLCGPAGDDPPAYLALDRGQVERICREALDQADRHAALRALRDVLPSLESDLAGLRNEGFLATHELRAGARRRVDWDGAGRKARGALAKRGNVVGERSEGVEGSGRLACPDDRFAAWAKEVGVACGPLAPDEKDDLIHELDAVVAHLYGLTEQHLVHIFETFHEGWDYEPRLRATLRHFREWKGRID